VPKDRPRKSKQSETPDAGAKKNEDLLATARARFKVVADAEVDIRREALDDLKFRSGDQWPQRIKNERDADDRPCLVVNRLPQTIRQVTNDQRQNRPSIKVHPVDDKSDVDTAKIYQGLIRHIEYNSGADTAYDTAFESAVTQGRGFFRILTKYCDPQSFEQEILIQRIRNPFMVYMDPSSKEPDGSDMNWCFISEDLTKEEFKALYPDSEVAGLEDFTSIGDQAPMWMEGGNVRVAEYFYKEYKEVDLVLLEDGTVFQKKVLPNPLHSPIKAERRAKVPVIKWAKINGIEILEEAEWVGQWIPVIPVIGEELDVDGKLILQGIVRNAKDPQRMLNYWKSSETEAIALAPRAPYIGVEGQFEGHETAWATANRKNHPYLQYKPKSIGGELAPPPQRQSYEPAVMAITNASLHAADDIKATTGVYDAALGNRSNESSGIAIQRRNQQSQTSNFHFVDNLTRSLRHAGRCLVDLIPKIYDTARAVRIIGEEDQHEIVRINEVFKKGNKDVEYRMSAGKYDVVIETGPNYATKRMEAAAVMVEMTSKNPKIMDAAGDLVLSKMDWPGAKEMGERWKKTMAPGLVDDAKDSPIPPALKAQMDQMSMMVEQLGQKLHAAEDIIENKRLELESREKIELEKIKSNEVIALAQIDAKDGQILLGHQVSEIQHRLDLMHAADQARFAAEQAESQFQEQAGSEGAAPSDDLTGEESPGLPDGEIQ
jgi:hypothetical protein